MTKKGRKFYIAFSEWRAPTPAQLNVTFVLADAARQNVLLLLPKGKSSINRERKNNSILASHEKKSSGCSTLAGNHELVQCWEEKKEERPASRRKKKKVCHARGEKPPSEPPRKGEGGRTRRCINPKVTARKKRGAFPISES